MRAFPQIGLGACAQYPFDQTVSFRTVINSLEPAGAIVYGDPNHEERQWRLPFNALTEDEWERVEALFEEVEGRLQSFVFLEPGSNLLSWSQSLSDLAWTTTAVTVVSGRPDPTGGTEAALLTSSSPGALSQAITAPSDFVYSGSCSIRTSDSGVTLRLQDGSGGQSLRNVAIDGQWKRYEVGFSGTPGQETVNFQVSLPSGASAEIFGPQLEAQTSAGLYKPTMGQAGVFPFTRFNQDHLTDRMSGPGSHSGEVQLIWTPSLN